MLPFRVLEQEKDSGDGDASDRQVDPELFFTSAGSSRQTSAFLFRTYTPPPRKAISKGSSKDWSDHGRYAKHASQYRDVQGPFTKRNGEADDGHGTRKEGGRTNTSYGPADDQHGGVDGGSAENRTKFENEQGHDVGPLDVEVCVHLAKARLKGGGRQEIG